MTHRVEAFGKIEDGVVRIYNERRFKNELGDLPNGTVVVMVQKKGRPSTSQRGYYRACVLPEITRKARECGNELTDEQWHEFFKLEFNGVDVFDNEGTKIGRIGQSTEGLSKLLYAEFLDSVMQFAAENMDLAIPPPNTQAKLFQIG